MLRRDTSSLKTDCLKNARWQLGSVSLVLLGGVGTGVSAGLCAFAVLALGCGLLKFPGCRAGRANPSRVLHLAAAGV